MTKYFVHITSEEEDRSVQETLFEHGYDWKFGEKYSKHVGDFIIVNPVENKITWTSRKPNEYHMLTRDNDYKMACGLNELLELLNINDMEEYQEFYVEVDGPRHSRILQEIAFEEGYGWNDGADQTVQNTDASFLTFGEYNSPEILYGSGSDLPHVDNFLADFSLEEFRQALNGEYFESEPDPIQVGDFEAEISDCGTSVEIGCRHYSFGFVDDIYTAMMVTNNTDVTIDISHPDTGRVSLRVISELHDRMTELQNS